MNISMKKYKTQKLKIHSYFDYLIATLMICSPWAFNLNPSTMESKIIVTVAIGIFLTNLITNHKLGLAKILKIKIHYRIDIFFGWFLIVSPFLYGFFSTTILPYLIFGILIFINAFIIKFPIKILSSQKVA